MASSEKCGNNYLKKPKFMTAFKVFEEILNTHLWRFYLLLLPTICEGDTGLDVPMCILHYTVGLLSADEEPLKQS